MTRVVELYSFYAALGALVVSALILIPASISRRRAASAKPSATSTRLTSCGLILQAVGLASLTLSVVARAIITGHGPFSNMYEFSIAFAWGILVAGLLFWRRYRTLTVDGLSIMVAVGLLIFASQLPSRHVPLVPALQQSLLLTFHVAAAVAAYGSFTVGFVSALLFIWQKSRPSLRLPRPETLEDISYRSVVIGFPLMTLVIILGALWADVAWGRYWGWDPKETASLVTWLIYAGYLHARFIRGWRGTKAAILLVAGFCAVLLTFFGNYIFSGLHSYT